MKFLDMHKTKRLGGECKFVDDISLVKLWVFFLTLLKTG